MGELWVSLRVKGPAPSRVGGGRGGRLSEKRGGAHYNGSKRCHIPNA